MDVNHITEMEDGLNDDEMEYTCVCRSFVFVYLCACDLMTLTTMFFVLNNFRFRN
jgi:hypothetical protein